MRFNIYRAGEQEIIDGCLRGERSAQQKLYDFYSPKMYGICCRYLRDPMQAEDALVSAFTRILKKISQYKGEGSLEAWIKTIVIREALAIIRKNQPLRMETDLENIDQQAVSQLQSDRLEQEDLLRMISELPTGYRTVFNLYAIDGYSHKEIAEQLHISESTSKSQLSRARVYLQEVLTRHEHIQTTTRNESTAR
ncbi:MAG TPA: sigma-70 family RNA polymerase sigma factor [Allocoleopsis sp.]